MFELVLRGGQVMTPGGLVATDIGVSNGKIAHIGQIASEKAGKVFDATGLTILPGVIDSPRARP